LTLNTSKGLIILKQQKKEGTNVGEPNFMLFRDLKVEIE